MVAADCLTAFRDGDSTPDAKVGAMLCAEFLDTFRAIAKGLAAGGKKRGR
jgi:hypothetical protein